MTAPPVTAPVRRPDCDTCRVRVDRFQHSVGAVIAYPCGHWHTPERARTLATLTRARQIADRHPLPTGAIHIPTAPAEGIDA